MKRDAVWIAAAGLLLLFTVDFVGDWRQTAAVERMREALIEDCEQEQAVDRVTVEDLQARIDLYTALIEMERDTGGHARTVAAYTTAQTQAQVRLQGVPAPQNCARVYASQ